MEFERDTNTDADKRIACGAPLGGNIPVLENSPLAGECDTFRIRRNHRAAASPVQSPGAYLIPHFVLFALCIIGSGGCATHEKKEPLPPPNTPKEALERHISELKGAAAADASDPVAQYMLGNGLFDAARYAEAKDAYQSAIRLKPDYAAAYCNLGLCLRLLGQIDDAIAAYDRALQLQPDEQTTLTNLIAALRAKGDAPAAEKHLQRLAELYPDDVIVHSELANVYFKNGQFDAAEAEFRRVIALDPGRSDDYYNLGACYVEMNKLNEALSTWLTALAFNPENASAHKGLAVLYWRRGEYDKAWDAVVECQTRGIPLDAEFLSSLQRDSGQPGPEASK